MRTELYWIPGPWPGRLAIMPRPRGGDWLEDEVRAWRSGGVDQIVSALESQEADELNLNREAELSKENGIEFIAFPIPDRGVPSSPKATTELLRALRRKLNDGQSVAIHCRQGIGRASLLAACLLALAGMTPDEAFERIQVARGCAVPDTADQRQWVAKFTCDSLLAPAN